MGKTKVVVSACLLGVPCRYDGRSKPSSDVRAFLEEHDCEVVAICPEVSGGLPIPHPAHEIQRTPEGYRVVDADGNDHTEAFETGARKACERASDAGCTHALLKAKSPSCGVGRVYDGTFSRTLVFGNGIAAAMLEEQGLIVATEEDFKYVFLGYNEQSDGNPGEAANNNQKNG